MKTIFTEKAGASTIAYAPEDDRIIFTTPMYSDARNNVEQRTVSIEEEEWMALVQYGRKLGWEAP